MAGVRFGRNVKPSAPLSFCWKISIAVFLGLSFVTVWYIFSSPLSSISARRNSFDDMQKSPLIPSNSLIAISPPLTSLQPSRKENKSSFQKEDKKAGLEQSSNVTKPLYETHVEEEETIEIDSEDTRIGSNSVEENQASEGDTSDEENESINTLKKSDKKNLEPLFAPTARYEWKLCGGRSKQNYIPCIDMGRAEGRRHQERSCPKRVLTCLVPLPKGYTSPVPWPESKSTVFFGNVAHPKLSALVNRKKWVNISGQYLMFSSEESEFQGGVQHYLDSIEEIVPDIEWGKNIRILLDIGCSDASFIATLLEKDVITLAFGLTSNPVDMTQVILEQGIPAMLGNLGVRRLPFPSGIFDAIHCSGCTIQWHSNGGRLLLEMNRILRPGGYFIMSAAHGDSETEEGLSSLTASICWNVLALKTDEISELSVKVYQRPASNDIYELRRKNEPPFCKEGEDQDFSWYTPINFCLHKLPAAIEERGTDWPEEWPKRLETFPEWIGDLQEKLIADDEHWKAIISRSYLIGMGIDWSKIRNVMDMKAIYGGFAAALASQKLWVMNVVPVLAPNTLPIIFERGLLGIYHDWCEPFSTYPRSYDLLHADHLFSRLKNRCKQPIVILVEMDRILRPGGWAIIREKSEILNPIEKIFISLHWNITQTFTQGKESIVCAQKTSWRPSA